MEQYLANAPTAVLVVGAVAGTLVLRQVVPWLWRAVPSAGRAVKAWFVKEETLLRTDVVVLMGRIEALERQVFGTGAATGAAVLPVAPVVAAAAPTAAAPAGTWTPPPAT
jgi:hypothetical protein